MEFCCRFKGRELEKLYDIMPYLTLEAYKEAISKVREFHDLHSPDCRDIQYQRRSMDE